MDLNLQDLRQEYASHTLDQSDVQAHPFAQFKIWFEEVSNSEVLEPNAMVLSTITLDQRPSARVVLLKELNRDGFVFFTNYESRKGAELAKHPYASLVFSWLELHRQVRVEGTVEKISAEDSTAYFQSRPKGSQIGAWASPQSQEINDRTILEDKVAALESTYQDQDILPRPAHWGGYLVKPTLIEFWQGRPSRLHDRIEYKKEEGTGEWKIVRLAP